MKEKTRLSIQIYFIVSVIIIVGCMFYLILPRILLSISSEKTMASVKVLYQDFEYGENYIEYSYKNKFNDSEYVIQRFIDYDQFVLLKGKKNINIYYGEYIPKYAIIEILGDSDYKIGILILLIFTFLYIKNKNTT